MQVDKEALRAQIRSAFANVPRPARIEDMRLGRYTGDDSYEMAEALLGKRWEDVPIQVLFYHRESLTSLSAAAYRAYLPAYLHACLASDDPFDKYGADLQHYLLATLKHWPHQTDERASDTRERLSLLDEKQREVVADVLHYLATHWHSETAAELLREWTTASR
ncbi:MAG TPA: DUF6714 family protein [Kofleriaceae bacterium]|nr:DUF6714 family protein [Kofleriaceae bacterium]